MKRFDLGGPALVVACIAFFVALTGGAVAAAVVPIAKHALTADTATNAKKLGGKTPAELKATLRGAQGPQGAAGPAGAAGATGATGPQGAAGAPGSEGAQGPQGQPGPQGAKGDKGDKGDQGDGLKLAGTAATQADLPATGTAGDAYLVAGELWVWNGTGWTNAGHVQGPDGPAGPAGPQGTAGPAGPQGPAGTAAVTVHTQAFSLAGGDGSLFTAACAAGQKAVSGGYSSNGDVFNEDTFPTTQGNGWSIYLINAGDGSVSGSVYAICLG